MGVHETRRHDCAAEVDRLVGLRSGGVTDRLDDAVRDRDPAVLVLRLGVVHRDHVRPDEQSPHHGLT
jgi:hypothetical protein